MPFLYQIVYVSPPPLGFGALALVLLIDFPTVLILSCLFSVACFCIRCLFHLYPVYCPLFICVVCCAGSIMGHLVVDSAHE